MVFTFRVIFSWAEARTLNVWGSTVGLACPTGGVHSLSMQVFDRPAMRFPLILVRSLWEPSFEGIEVERVELDGVQQWLLVLVSKTRGISHAVPNETWMFEYLIGCWSLLRP